ncbi:MAG: hypothetical protein U0136_16460 [Bdellovibrionota bacterium]
MKFSRSTVRVAQTAHGLLTELNGVYRLTAGLRWQNLACRRDAFQVASRAFHDGVAVAEPDVHRLLRANIPLIDPHLMAVLAFGVTFRKSEVARDEEFKVGGNVNAVVQASAAPSNVKDTPYTRVGPRANPAELFGKAKTRKHLFLPGEAAGIRSVETLSALLEGKVEMLPPWNIHEPEIATVMTPDGIPIGFLPALDMSDRRDEGISPLLLTKAKIFWHCCGFGHWCTIPEDALAFWESIVVRSWVERNGYREWPIPTEPDEMSATQCRRPLTELCQDVVDADFVDEGEPAVFLSGTGIVPAPGDSFSLLPGDTIKYFSDQLGTLHCGVQLIPRPRRDLSAQIEAATAS